MLRQNEQHEQQYQLDHVYKYGIHTISNVIVTIVFVSPPHPHTHTKNIVVYSQMRTVIQYYLEQTAVYRYIIAPLLALKVPPIICSRRPLKILLLFQKSQIRHDIS